MCVGAPYTSIFVWLKLTGKVARRSEEAVNNSKTWTEEDDKQLLEAIKEHASAKATGPTVVRGVRRAFNAEDVQLRWDIIKGPPVKGPWTRVEDALSSISQALRPQKWSVIMTHVPGRRSKQCRRGGRTIWTQMYQKTMDTR